MSSPYLRCVETASSICQRLGSRTRLMVDLGLGEVYGPEIFGEKPEKAIRSCREIEEHLRTVYGTTVLPVSTVGVWPTWPETLALARRRFAERLLVYISRGRRHGGTSSWCPTRIAWMILINPAGWLGRTLQGPMNCQALLKLLPRGTEP